MNYNPVDILLVEDNPNDIELTLRAFKKAKVSNQIVVVRDGFEAVQYLEDCKRNPEKPMPGLVLLDLNLPKMSGHEVLQHIKGDRQLARIPVIMLTASTREEDVVRSYDLGVNTFISKPVQFADFMRVVGSIQEYWIIIATLPPTTTEVSAAPSAGVRATGEMG
jgi:CheY-like chemotaxis protein